MREGGRGGLALRPCRGEQMAQATVNGRRGGQEGQVLILWTVGAKGSFWADGEPTRSAPVSKRTRELAARLTCSELSSVGLVLPVHSGVTVGSPGGLIQVQTAKPIPTPEDEPAQHSSHFPNRNPMLLLSVSAAWEGRTPGLCALGSWGWARGRGLAGQSHGLAQGGVCDQSLANKHQLWAFSWNIRDQTFSFHC